MNDTKSPIGDLLEHFTLLNQNVGGVTPLRGIVPSKYFIRWRIRYKHSILPTKYKSKRKLYKTKYKS